MILIVMGVAGSGKTTVGKLLAEKLCWEFLDADDYHTEENVQKMSHGIALTDEDRAGWLVILAALVKERLDSGKNAILACSALKQSYRDILSAGDARVKYIYLKGTQEDIALRMHERPGHFMKPGMLESQFAALEEPGDALTVDIQLTADEISRLIIRSINL